MSATITTSEGPIAGVHTYAGDCPICGQSIMACNRQLPHNCPTCNHPLRSTNPDSPLHNVLHCLRLYCDPRGRSTRREFWAFTLTALALFVLEGAVILLCNRAGYLSQIPVWTWLLLPALLVCPFGMVTIRRLHDLDKGPGLLIVFLALAILGTLAVVLHADGILPEIFTKDVAAWGWTALRADIIVGSIILYLSTQHRLYGPNKYGPAPK